jgi:hypothetical protein
VAWNSGAKASAAIAAAAPSYGRGAGGGDGGAHYEYTERAVHLVAAYQREFPAVFEMLEAAPERPSFDKKFFSKL